jgi:predicted cupin superfamily sugar epimerase
MTADEIIKMLDLKPHPEGGYFRETFRDDASTDGRAHSTAIYYLLRAGDTSHWHRVDAAEVWHWYAGDALALSIITELGVQHVTLGSRLDRGERPQGIVPAHHWQSARPLGAFALVGCTVAPGFEFAGFEMAPSGWMPGSR